MVGVVDWIGLAEDRDKWPAVMNTVIKFICSIF